MYQNLKCYIATVRKELSEISGKRKAILQEIAEYIRTQKKPKLTFICTHNSRRSLFCQIWSATFAHHFGLKELELYSGGTRATAFNPRAVAAVVRAGFKVKNPGGENPRYRVFFGDHTVPIICFSKTFDDPYNPRRNFAAIMTCSEADRSCPAVPGADRRFSIPYADPKASDGTLREEQTYDERCRQIATEMFYLSNKV